MRRIERSIIKRQRPVEYGLLYAITDDDLPKTHTGWVAVAVLSELSPDCYHPFLVPARVMHLFTDAVIQSLRLLMRYPPFPQFLVSRKDIQRFFVYNVIRMGREITEFTVAREAFPWRLAWDAMLVRDSMPVLTFITVGKDKHPAFFVGIPPEIYSRLQFDSKLASIVMRIRQAILTELPLPTMEHSLNTSLGTHAIDDSATQIRFLAGLRGDRDNGVVFMGRGLPANRVCVPSAGAAQVAPGEFIVRKMQTPVHAASLSDHSHPRRRRLKRIVDVTIDIREDGSVQVGVIVRGASTAPLKEHIRARDSPTPMTELSISKGSPCSSVRSGRSRVGCPSRRSIVSLFIYPTRLL